MVLMTILVIYVLYSSGVRCGVHGINLWINLMWAFAIVSTNWRNTMRYNSNQRACAICQSAGVTAVTWDNVPLCATHWQERERMHLGSDQLFQHQTAVESFEWAVQQKPSPVATIGEALCA